MKVTKFFKGLCMMAFAVPALMSCNPKVEEQKDELSVSPSTAIEFAATDNEAVKLTVTTNVEKWEFSAPEWVVAEKQGNILSVNAEPNTGNERLGRLTITAGVAEPVKITVKQAAAGEVEPEPGDGVQVTFNRVGEELLFIGKDPLVAKVNASIEEAVDFDINGTITFDEKYLGEYNFINGKECELFPQDKVSFSAEFTIPKGQTVSEDVEITLDGSALEFAVSYLVPLKAEVEENSGAEVIRTKNRANFMLLRSAAEKKIRNVLYFEVNDTNPLNALEYNLADGTPFFDAIIIFAANINYDAINGEVYLHNNPNVQALLNETDVYLQPLRKKGIKVYLGLLGNHDASGVCQLSDWGAWKYAQTLAKAVRDYKLDGVSLDDEYSDSPDMSNPWFTSQSAQAGSQLMLELKLAMKKECYWPTEVSFFDWGALYSAHPSRAWDPEKDGTEMPADGSVKATGENYTPNQFVDFHVANYGGSSGTFYDLGLEKCSCMSLECNQGRGSISESSAKSAVESGYGWCMWFAFDPSGTGTINSNYWWAFPKMQAAARGFYDQELLTPTKVYHKIGEGKYDPTPHDFQN